MATYSNSNRVRVRVGFPQQRDGDRELALHPPRECHGVDVPLLGEAHQGDVLLHMRVRVRVRIRVRVRVGVRVRVRVRVSAWPEICWT